ncbi:hypothetical protein ACFLU8_02095 [Chloroflexota bacterium]
MTFMERIEKMNPREIASRPEVKALWDKSLFWSLAHRRSYKYAPGANIPKDAFFDHEPKMEPVPLTEVELALLCWAAAGTNGIMRNDLSFGQLACTHPWFEGRVYPSGCNVWYGHLIFSTDDGILLYRPHVPTKIVEIETQSDMEVIFRSFKEGIVQLSDEPIKIPDDSPVAEFMNSACMFKPGVTTFFPVIDVTVEQLNLYLIREINYLFDDEAGKPAGIQRWIDKGYIKGTPIPLSLYEAAEGQTLLAHAFYMQQNLQLCAAAMGLGGFIFAGGFNIFKLLSETLDRKGMGFRFAKDKRGYPYPVGIDGLIETHMPPYMSIDEAVDDIWNMKFKPGFGRYSSEVKEGDEVMYHGFDPMPRAVYRPFKEPEKYTKAVQVQPPEVIQIAKDIANYIYNTYGRFPKMFNPITCQLQVQIAHIDPNFYDKYQAKGSIWEEQREHFNTWHGNK